MLKAVLFKSAKRFDSFLDKLKEYNIRCDVLDFEGQAWVNYDYSDIDIVIYFPSFKYSSNYPLALSEVHDNLLYIHTKYPGIKMFPDPHVIKYYNDKYRQFLFLQGNGFPIPATMPLFSPGDLDLVAEKFGFPVVVKNRYGAGGGAVFKVNNRKELEKYYKISRLNLFNVSSVKYLLSLLSKREFYWELIKCKKCHYPFLSSPLLAQKYIYHDRDLKTVVGTNKVVEAHWRYQASPTRWKVNIDDGGLGVWEKVPAEALELSVKLAKKLKTRWLNIDLIRSEDQFLITEFSPVWHHYKYKEKSSFVYRDDYNIDLPLEVSLDLERIIVESLL